MGIFPDIIVTRSDEPIDQDVRDKIALFCDVKPDCVIENLTLPSLYQAPIMLEKSHFSDIVCRELSIAAPAPDLTEWNDMLHRIDNRSKTVRIALVGKYVRLHDAYLSVAEALRHGGFENSANVAIDWVDSESLSPANAREALGNADGIIVPGGFGDRGWLAIALVIFALWKPKASILGSILFGGLYIVYLYIPGLSRASQEIFKMLPYVVTIVVLIVISIRNRRENQPPESLGLSYFREER